MRRGIKAAIVITVLASLGTGMASAAGATSTADVRAFGATGDGVTNDTVAIQRAIDSLVPLGGGDVTFPDGTYVAGGLRLPSHVALTGGRGAVLQRPDGAGTRAIVTSARATVTGSIFAGSKLLRLSAKLAIEPGTPIAIRGAASRMPVRYLYDRVESVSSSTITIGAPAQASVINETIAIGAQDIAVRGMTLDGGRASSGSASATPIEFMLARNATVLDTLIRNGGHSAVSFDLGTSDSRIESNTFVDNGKPDQTQGSAIWLFRGARRNVVRNNSIGGDGYRGIFIDDRTQTATEWDGSSDANLIEDNRITLPSVTGNSGIHVVGSSYNTLRRNVVAGPQVGIAVEQSAQGIAGPDAQSNALVDNALHGHNTGLRVSGSNNSFVRSTITETTRPVDDTGRNNTFS